MMSSFELLSYKYQKRDASFDVHAHFLRLFYHDMPKGRQSSSSYGKSVNSKLSKPTVSIPKNSRRSFDNSRSPSGSPASPITPKTPADEGIEFFQSELKQGESPIRVYELRLDPDGGPNKETSV
jgi:glycogen debranching enzyme